jgi:hypothetical protein
MYGQQPFLMGQLAAIPRFRVGSRCEVGQRGGMIGVPSG